MRTGTTGVANALTSHRKKGTYCILSLSSMCADLVSSHAIRTIASARSMHASIMSHEWAYS